MRKLHHAETGVGTHAIGLDHEPAGVVGHRTSAASGRTVIGRKLHPPATGSRRANHRLRPRTGRRSWPLDVDSCWAYGNSVKTARCGDRREHAHDLLRTRTCRRC